MSQETLEDIDKNKDGFLSVDEYIGMLQLHSNLQFVLLCELFCMHICL